MSLLGYVENKGVRKGGWVHEKIGLKMIGTTIIRKKRGIQWERPQRRVLGRGVSSMEKIGLKVIGTTAIRTKRGIQW
jgi:hypothetical protein